MKITTPHFEIESTETRYAITCRHCHSFVVCMEKAYMEALRLSEAELLRFCTVTHTHPNAAAVCAWPLSHAAPATANFAERDNPAKPRIKFAEPADKL